MKLDFGLSNLYLKVGFALLAISVIAVAGAFAVPSATRYLSASFTGFCFVAGTVLYLIGRVVQVRRARSEG